MGVQSQLSTSSHGQVDTEKIDFVLPNAVLELENEYTSTLLMEAVLINPPHLTAERDTTNIESERTVGADNTTQILHAISGLQEDYAKDDYVPEDSTVFEEIKLALQKRTCYLARSHQSLDQLCKAYLQSDPLSVKKKAKHYSIMAGTVRTIKGIVHFVRPDKLPTSSSSNKSEIRLAAYYKDLASLLSLSATGAAKSFAYKRLVLLEQKYDIYTNLNEFKEQKIAKAIPHRDFYNVYKVDTHVHMASSSTQQHLLKFIREKIKTSGAQKVIMRDGKELTLAEVFESLKITAHDLSVDFLDMHVDNSTFHRFDRFNLKYNPIGEARLREIFLKTDNHIGGQYFAELAGQVIKKLEKTGYTCAEYRISVYGLRKDETIRLARWYHKYPELQSRCVSYLIQVPRLFNVYYQSGKLDSFAEMMENIFEPIYAASIDESYNPALASFLAHVGGFDSVDDESKVESCAFDPSKITADAWRNIENNPPYSYYLYYMYENIRKINKVRASKNMNTFSLRPHCGEVGLVDHLASGFLLAESINHGIVLKKSPVLEYLYYLAQVGIAISPLSNNYLFLSIQRSPLLRYFKRGLSISLSTDDPLQFHLTNQPLLEEFSVAAATYKLSTSALCELALNSVRQSSFSTAFKKEMIGDGEIEKTNVPQLRLQYRKETRLNEFKKIGLGLRSLR